MKSEANSKSNFPEKMDRTALNSSQEARDKKMVRLLLARNANPEQETDRGPHGVKYGVEMCGNRLLG